MGKEPAVLIAAKPCPESTDRSGVGSREPMLCETLPAVSTFAFIVSLHSPLTARHCKQRQLWPKFFFLSFERVIKSLVHDLFICECLACETQLHNCSRRLNIARRDVFTSFARSFLLEALSLAVPFPNASKTNETVDCMHGRRSCAFISFFPANKTAQG